MDKFLVAGGAGFIGSHLVKRLLDEGHQVTVVDDLSSGRIENLEGGTYYNLDFRQADICSYQDTDEYDYIVNLACPASPIAYQLAPIQTMLTNVQGTYQLLSLAFLKNARFLQASTSEVYGDPQVHPQTEDYWGNVNCYGPRSCYDEGKRAAEALVFDFQRVTALDARIIRIFNTYGPNMAPDDGRVVSNFIVQALQGQDLTIYGDGSQTRSFCYVSDTVEALLRVLRGDYSRPLNVGNPVEHTMKELATAVLRALKDEAKWSNVKYLPLPKDDPKQRKPNIDQIKKLYKWKPTVKLDKGLTYTVDYFRQVLDQQKGKTNDT